MASNSLTSFSATGSPSLPNTTVSFLASISINEQTIPINTGDVTQGIKNLKFSLAAPVELGSLADFIDYLNTSVGVPLSSEELLGYIDKIPSSPDFLLRFKEALVKIATTSLWVTVLNIDVSAGLFTLGVAFPVDLKLTSFLTINTIGVVVSRGEQGSPD
jgi:hypothetical protein